MAGSITRLPSGAYRLKFETGRDPVTGARGYHRETVRGTKKEAEATLTRLMAAHDLGLGAPPGKETLTAYMAGWLDRAEARGLSARTVQRYRQLARLQVDPFIGSLPLAKLRPGDVADWHGALLARGGENGEPLAARTVGHAHRLLRKALADAARQERVGRNVCALEPPPSVADKPMVILDKDQVKVVQAALHGEPIGPAILTLLALGCRRGELCALRWNDLDLVSNRVRIERSVEKANRTLSIKPPKTRAGTRTIALPEAARQALATRRRYVQELRLKLGAGRIGEAEYIFGNDTDGTLRDPDRLTQDWSRLVVRLGLPDVTLHALRHTSVSMLIAGKLDAVKVARRVGHANPRVTLSIYAHLFDHDDSDAVASIDAALGAT